MPARVMVGTFVLPDLCAALRERRVVLCRHHPRRRVIQYAAAPCGRSKIPGVLDAAPSRYMTLVAPSLQKLEV
jgi:hypothetical protein